MKAIKVMRGPFFNLGFTLYSLFYLYVLIGMEIFGGRISADVFVAYFNKYPDSGITGDYIWLNFNDFASGLIVLESMMLFNNWQFIWDQFRFTIDDTAVTNAYFLTFMVMATYVLINILMAFVIDVYTSIEDAQREEEAERRQFIDFGKAQTKLEKSKTRSAVLGALAKAEQPVQPAAINNSIVIEEEESVQLD
jgi:hypothetical protein